MPIRYKRSFTPKDHLMLSDWAGNRGQCNPSRQHSHHIYSPPHSRAAPCRLQTFHWWSPGRSPGSCCFPLQGDGCKWNVVHPGACRESKLIIVFKGCNCILLFLWVTIHSFMALYINGGKNHDLTNKNLYHAIGIHVQNVTKSHHPPLIRACFPDTVGMSSRMSALLLRPSSSVPDLNEMGPGWTTSSSPFRWSLLPSPLGTSVSLALMRVAFGRLRRGPAWRRGCWYTSALGSGSWAPHTARSVHTSTKWGHRGVGKRPQHRLCGERDTGVWSISEDEADAWTAGCISVGPRNQHSMAHRHCNVLGRLSMKWVSALGLQQGCP